MRKLTINGKSFELFVSDNVTTVLDRIATDMNTTPDWLVFAPKRPTSLNDFNSGLTVTNYLDKVLNQNTLTLPSSPYPVQQDATRIQDLFIATNAALTSVDDKKRQLLFSTIRGTYKDPEDMWRDGSRQVGILKKQIANVASRTRDRDDMAKRFETIPIVEYTTYETDYVQFTLDLGSFNGTLESLFNALVTSRHVPFAILSAGERSTLYKLHAGTAIDPDWLNVELSRVLLLKAYSGNKQFTNTAFAIVDGALIATVNLKVGVKYVDKSVYLSNVFGAFDGLNLQVQEERDNQVIVYYSIPNQCMDPTVFSELAMNNDMYNSVIAIDEFLRPSKTTDALYLHRLEEQTTINIAPRQTKRANEHGMVDIGEWYVRCRVKTFSIDNVVSIQSILGRLFTIYRNVYDNVVVQYKNVVSDYSPMTCEHVRPKRAIVAKGLRGIAPEVFFPTYSRRCAHGPTVIKSTADANGAQTMMFPTHGERWNGRLVESRLYTCKEASHPYIGLRKNELDNKTVFPMVPCCFKKDQIDRPGSLYRKYYHGENERVVTRQIQETEAYKRRPLDPTETEELPDAISRLLNTLEPDPNVSFVRNGVTRTRLASIEAILLGKGQVAYRKMRKTTVANRVISEARKMDSDVYAMAAKQEMPGMTIAEIRADMRTEALRPSRFVHALETLLDCNLFVFSSSSSDRDGRLVVPDHLSAYIKYKPTRETFLLYEHGDEESTWPAVELVTRTSGGSFLPGDDIVSGLYDFFSRLTRAYALNVVIPAPVLPRLDIVEQMVDSNGKCRVLNVAVGKSTIASLVTTPLAPFAAPPAIKVYRSSAKFALTIGRPMWQKRGEIGLMIGNVSAIMLTNVDNLLPNVPINDEPTEYDDIQTTNAVALFGETQRHAAILLQFALKSFFTKYSPISQTNITDKLDQFLKNDVIIDPTVRYKAESSSKFADNTSFYRGDKILVRDDNTAKRMAFVMRIVSLGPKATTLATRDLTIPNFYASVSDFDQHQSTLVLEGKRAVENVLKSLLYSDGIYTSIRNSGDDHQYFFRNTHLSNSVLLAVPTSSLIQANAIVVFWSRHGYVNVTASDDGRPAIYNYINESEILKISGSDDMYDGMVVAYKTDVAKYIAMLKM